MIEPEGRRLEPGAHAAPFFVMLQDWIAVSSGGCQAIVTLLDTVGSTTIATLPVALPAAVLEVWPVSVAPGGAGVDTVTVGASTATATVAYAVGGGPYVPA